MTAIAVLNPQSGNITSICDALARLGREVRVVQTPDQLGEAGQIVLPGQGRFGAVMTFLKDNGWVATLRNWAASGRPLFGICVGMQVLFDASEEDPGIPGLGIIDGEIKRLNSPKQPMIGWSRVHWLAQGFPDGAAYFVNSYVLQHHPNALAITSYGERFCCALARGSVMAVQFHPEKSGAWGQELLKKCLVT